MVTALGCFGGDFNMDNGLLLSFSYKVSDLVSDKFSVLRMQPRKTLIRSSGEGGSDPTTTVTHRASKGGVAPASGAVWARTVSFFGTVHLIDFRNAVLDRG
jgi:hypothetical protein